MFYTKSQVLSSLCNVIIFVDLLQVVADENYQKLTTFTLILITIVFFTAKVTHSTTKMALTNTNISIHILKDALTLIDLNTIARRVKSKGNSSP